jgi:hypothetical protein
MYISLNESVFLKATTWNRESHGLFEYSSQHVTSKNLKTSSNSKIVRIQNDVHIIADNSDEKNLNEEA